ncbi:hypothetical protein CIB84_013912, partial [Bambusicola thoracicus]
MGDGGGRPPLFDDTEDFCKALVTLRVFLPFKEDVDSFMKQPGNETADVVLKKLDEQYQKYKFLELNLAQKKRRLKGQIPEIKQTLEILKHMQKKK